MPKPAVSVIVPVYRIEKYLPQCAGSILRQSFSLFELILVDDGSTDGSAAICDRLALEDPRVRVIHQQNGGVSKARNRGLDEAKGDFVVFIDGDDTVEQNYLLDLIRAQQALDGKEEKVMVLSDYQPFSDNGPEKRTFPSPFSMDFRTGEGLNAENFRELIFNFRLFPPYCKLYRLDVINGNQIRFREGMRSAEDFEFNTKYLAAVDRLEYIDSVQYNYRVGYKSYVPSNHGVLGGSEIKSAHIMAHGISDLAERMGILDEVGQEVDLWAANKHYFNRLRMLFMKSGSVGTAERREFYNELISDPVYYGAARRGAKLLPKSMTKRIAMTADCFTAWKLFYSLRGGRVDKR